jgi:hypothetical protein
MHCLDEAATIDQQMIGQIFSISSEPQRLVYLQELQGNYDLFLSCMLRFRHSHVAGIHKSLDLILKRKAIGAEALGVQRDTVLGERYPNLKQLLETLTTLRMQVAQKTLAGPGSEDLETHQRILAEWNTRKERLEAELVRQIPEMNMEAQLRAADHQAVARALPPGTSLIEFVRFEVFDFEAIPARDALHWGPAHYLAFVLPAGEPNQAHMIDLGETALIDRMIAAFRTSITGEAEQGDQQNLTAPVLDASQVSVRSDRSILRSAIVEVTRHL